MNNKTEAYQRLEHVAEVLLKARDQVKEAQIAFDLERGYQAHRIAEKACEALSEALDGIQFASTIGEIMAKEKRHAGGCANFKDAEVPQYLRRQAE